MFNDGTFGRGGRLFGDLCDIPELTALLRPGEELRGGIKKVVDAAALSSARTPSRVPQGAREVIPKRFGYQDILEPIIRHHPAVAGHFFTGVGVELMRVGSDLTMDLLVDLSGQGIVALPIHDAVVVPEGD